MPWVTINSLDSEGPRQGRAPLQIQREMVDRGLPPHETTAAKTFLVQFSGEFKKAWAKLRKARRTTSRRKPSSGFRRSPFRVRSSTNGSVPSVTRGSVVTGSSHDSTPSFSPAGSTSSVRSANGRRDALSATIRVLRLTHQMADMAHAPVLREVNGTALRIAQLIEVSTPLLTARRGS